MVKAIITFVIAIIILLIAFIIKSAHQKERTQIENSKQTIATIDQTIYSDTGEVMYYISFIENGMTIVAQTDYYTSETKSLNPGDQVKISYFYINEKTVHAVILDDRVIPVSDSDLSVYRFMIIVGILLLLIAATMIAKAMFFQN